jgi:hypothetical protein
MEISSLFSVDAVRLRWLRVADEKVSGRGRLASGGAAIDMK